MGTIVNLYADFETGSDGDVVDTSILNASTHPLVLNGSYSTWLNGVPGAFATTKIRTAGQQTMRGEVTTGDIDYVDAGSRGMAYDHLVNPEEIIYFDFDTPVDRASAGFLFMTTATYQDFNTFSMFSLYEAGGNDYSVFNWESFNSGDHSVRAHTALGTSATNIPILRNVWYWVTLLFERSNLARVNVYSVASFPYVQIGVTSTLGIGDWACGGFNFGKVGGSGAWPAYLSYYDNIIIDNVNGVWPLLPSPGDAPQFNLRKQERRPSGFAPGLAR